MNQQFMKEKKIVPLLVAFREGNFLVNEEPVPISNYIGNRLEVLHE